ncbi:N-acetylglucosamine-6-phosphate deacetylase [Microbacterium binotii]|uniref:N-acetylglucosamine-6-phosphate deacetylase n=1 Tax=Microbacterium binotii TaxID=462710 RepID=A0ABN3P759_9MICO
MAVSVIVHSVRIVDGGREMLDGWVRWEAGRITHRGAGDGWREHSNELLVDARAAAGPDAVLTPGFIDLHGHGGGGHSYEDGPDAVRAARALHRAHGTTRAVLSLATATLGDLVERLETIAELARTDPDILGSHLEGPFLAPSHRGAHAGDLLRAPDPETLDMLLAAGEGTVRQVTLAPELPGGLDAVRRIVAAGVVAAVGHTAADAALAAEAFDAGATVLTHAFNAMPGLHHRVPGPVGAALADDRVVLEIIADGVHLHPDIVRIAASAAAGRVALVTDAMAAAGAADGAYRLGALDVEVADGVAHVAGTDTIAGSTLTQDAALRVAVTAGVALPAAVHALTETPARVLGREDLGTLEPGRLADAVLLTADLRVAGVWLAGDPV